MFDYAVGQRAELARTFAAADVADFAALVGGDLDGIEHVPSGLVGGLFSTLLGTTLPGRGTNWMKQTLRFRSRARVGERLTASVEVVRLRPDKRLVNLRVSCVTDAGATVCEGEALVLALEMLAE
ncbi:MAG: phosphate acetyltransferase [bacterium]|nr:phosphate acetyltransferase [bacterium]